MEYTLQEQDLARALSHTYGLLSRLTLEGVSPPIRLFLDAIPPFAEALAECESSSSEDLAAEHYRILSMEIFPYESIFLESEQLIGGETAALVQALYDQAGYTPNDASLSGDHLGIELGFLAWITGEEALAWEAGAPGAAHQMRLFQSRFLEDHLLRWLIPCAEAIRRQDHAVFSRLATVTVETVIEHHALLSQSVIGPHSVWELPPLPDLLDDESTGLKDIGRFLLTPVYSGLYLSRRDIEELARSYDLPRGFGPRDQMLGNLFNSAVRYDSLDKLLGDLTEKVRGWDEVYAAWAESVPALRSFLAPWRDRLSSTQSMLGEMRSSLK